MPDPRRFDTRRLALPQGFRSLSRKKVEAQFEGALSVPEVRDAAGPETLALVVDGWVATEKGGLREVGSFRGAVLLRAAGVTAESSAIAAELECQSGIELTLSSRARAVACYRDERDGYIGRLVDLALGTYPSFPGFSDELVEQRSCIVPVTQFDDRFFESTR